MVNSNGIGVNPGSGDGVAVTGASSRNAGVKGISFTADGVFGQGPVGVRGEGPVGVRGDAPATSGETIGVKGESHSFNGSGVQGLGWNNGTGVVGSGRVGVFGTSPVNGWSAIWGRHFGSGNGVAGDSVSGPGIVGFSTSGYGGSFDGGKAQLFIKPKATAGKPTSGAHSKGEIYMDSKGSLFVCSASGTPGTWRKVTTTLV